MIQATLKHRVTASSHYRRPAICHVIHAMGVGGAEVLVSQMVRRFSDQFRCLVAVLDDIGELGRQLQRDGFTVEHLHRKPGIDHACARRLRAFADREGVSLLHAHQCTPFFQSMLSRGLRGQRPVVLTEHGRHFPDLPSRKRALVNRLLLRREDRLIACGEAVRSALIANEGLPADRIDVILNGVDLSALARPDVNSRDRIRQEFGFGPGDPVIVLVARLHPLKDHQTALNTMERVRAVIPSARLLLVGDGELRDVLHQAIHTRGLQDVVRLAGSRNDIADILAASDTFLMTSLSEGIPLTVIEAMAARLPIVATRVGGIPEMIRDGHSGLLAPASDDQQLAQHLIRLAQQPALRHQLGQQAAEDAAARFSLDTMLQCYRSVYRDVLSGVGR